MKGDSDITLGMTVDVTVGIHERMHAAWESVALLVAFFVTPAYLSLTLPSSENVLLNSLN